MDVLTIILILILLAVAFWIGNSIGGLRRDRHWENLLPGHRKDAVERSRAVLGGQFSEQIAPFLPGFPYLPTECRFMGKPVDLIVFKGLDEKKIDEVVFVEVKTGKSKTSLVEKSLKEAVEKKKVRWEEYRVDENLTGKSDKGKHII
ncbi:MAG: Holliday junction resolvase-like protein [Candidatus Pacearchaeota archaeon]